jgi:hypothetical protein
MMMNAMKRVERLKTQVVVVDSRDDNAGGGIPMTSRLERQETFFSSPWVRVLFFSLSLFCNGASKNRFLFSFLVSLSF